MILSIGLLTRKLPRLLSESSTCVKEKGAIVRDADSRKMIKWIIKDEKNG